MTTLVPRKPYTDEELQKLYPDGLELQLVQVLMRHGERTPVTVRFQNTGLPAFWPYCSTVRQMKSAILSASDQPIDTLEWKRRLETFGENDEPIVARGPSGQRDDICEMGALTDIGRQSTYNLGHRLRQLYVDRLKFIPPTITSTDSFYLRSTPVPRAMESLHQAFSGLYPPSARQPGPDGKFPSPIILTRAHADETLYPNDGNCRRFAALSRAFAQRAADRWNNTPDMEYLNSLYGKWMGPDMKVAVDSRPRLSGIMDTINATLAHGPATKLPKEFYDAKGKGIIEKIAVEEWYAGYKESKEFRTLGIGGLMGDLVMRMVGSVEGSGKDGSRLVKEKDQESKRIRFALHGCHDTTLAGVLASLGAFETNKWPPFTSHIALELFRDTNKAPEPAGKVTQTAVKTSWWSSLFSSSSSASNGEIGRRRTEDLGPSEQKKMDGYYVRLRYNDEPVTVPGCRKPGKHLEGDESFCTLAAFKEIVDKFTPQNWKEECRLSRGELVQVPATPELAGE